ncbi:MAG: RluA family pseudouridine synthase [Proteobacteria bacterium]|nr:RluA family pseudouridine synthase [Pseudomonadota bacterium]MDA1290503.1 RluA family pseudouridine synthase [Pseudomonadota bacterium]
MKSNTSVSDGVQLVRVEKSHIGQRLDNFLIRHLKGVPRTRVYRLIRRGEVRVNKKRCKPDRKLELGDEVRIPPYTTNYSEQTAKPSPALQEFLLNSILLENDDLLVINKPAGMAVHGGTSVAMGLIEALRQCKPEWGELELAHRIDRGTTGCLVISKNSIFLKHIQNQFKVKNVQKHYLALVHGTWPESLNVVDAPLQKDSVGESEHIVRVLESGKPSLTRFAVKQHFDGASLIEAMPQTGRTHQIRVHCQHSGHGIVGDDKYTFKVKGSALSKVKNLCLHAWKIEFELPEGATSIRVEAPIPNHLDSLIQKLGK